MTTPPLPAPMPVRRLTPSWFAQVAVTTGDGGDADAIGIPVLADGEVPDLLETGREALRRAGFTGALGSALAEPRGEGPALVAVGMGEPSSLDAAAVRDAAAAFVRAVPADAALAMHVPTGIPAGEAAAAIVEGALLARHRFDLRSTPKPNDPVAVTSIVLVPAAGDQDAVTAGAARGLVTARAALVSRDLAACPASLLTATAMADVAVELGSEVGLEVEVTDLAGLVELGCGGLLGVNRGSEQEPRMVHMTYTPPGEATGHLGLVGKGITYDSGGISLKPGDESHSQMKNDMSGAGAILATMLALPALEGRARIEAWLMCTDNMPSGRAMQLGDVLTTRGGTTVEVINTDAEGRLVMSDALVLAVEAGCDAIVDVATLTGACLRTFGTEVAGVMGNRPELVAAVTAAGEKADEPVWQLPLIASYRSQLDSEIADLKNLGGPNAGAITAALFLEHFVGDVPWAHIDIAGTAQAPAATAWVNRGPTGFGARLLCELAVGFGS
ncbi:leucyl aminopeptidase family protein [Pseudactinotalea suaedae]|uniref:leucyl aminopeptidase family protein n=1 Tax=Pseudactinotalea suaedae TaxID=1524924 RepID=UPI001F502667|nr:leucyl aminopeptidase [Pseudactinotalea suaedae]